MSCTVTTFSQLPAMAPSYSDETSHLRYIITLHGGSDDPAAALAKLRAEGRLGELVAALPLAQRVRPGMRAGLARQCHGVSGVIEQSGA